jgi:hypothetical protein
MKKEQTDCTFGKETRELRKTNIITALFFNS